MTLDRKTLRNMVHGFSFAACVLAVIFMGSAILDGWENEAYERTADIMAGAGLLSMALAGAGSMLSAPLGLVLLLLGSTSGVVDTLVVIALAVWAIIAIVTALAKRSAARPA